MRTLYALSSGALPSGVAVIRVSGKKSRFVSEMICGTLAVPRQFFYRLFKDPENGNLIDHGLVCFFAAPNSFTGEDVVEFHLHGGVAIVQKMLSVLSRYDDLELAEPGGFTRQALFNGKMDLTAVEGLADLIGAETEMQRQQALSLARGTAGALIASWRQTILELRAMIEADLDFSDEDDVPDSLFSEVVKQISNIYQKVDFHCENKAAERLRSGLDVVLLGAPNVGKSSLLNHLAQRDVAIVTDIAGTTRDLIEIKLDISGYPVTLVDTAGLHGASQDHIEKIGMDRARARADNADLVLFITDEEVPSKFIDEFSNCISIRSKADLIDSTSQQSLKSDASTFDIILSVHTGVGIDQLLEQLKQKAAHAMTQSEPALITHQRQRDILFDVRACLQRSLNLAAEPVLLAEELRLAHRALGRMTGHVDVEDILDVIFANFCIGK
jgi:tRNA modification GTPase